jgi:hypothetical protein
LILLDYSQIALGNIYSFADSFKVDRKAKEDPANIMRHCILTTIKSYKTKYGKQYGDIVICCDGRNYWRKEYFPNYKANRKKKRDSSDLDWKMIFDTMSVIKNEIIEFFPYKVVQVDNCEADDIIATLTKETCEFGKQEDVLIVSSDGDFRQLLLLGDHIKQWSPKMKKFIKESKQQLLEYTIEHIVKGDDGDGIPNILSPDDVFVTEGTRQGKMSSKRLHEFFEKGKDACRTDQERIRWDRNESLVSFEKIPDYISESILTAYNNCKPSGSRTKIFNYLLAKDCKLLLNDIEGF